MQYECLGGRTTEKYLGLCTTGAGYCPSDAVKCNSSERIFRSADDSTFDRRVVEISAPQKANRHQTEKSPKLPKKPTSAWPDEQAKADRGRGCPPTEEEEVSGAGLVLLRSVVCAAEEDLGGR